MYTIDREIFVAKNFWSMTFSDENKTCEIYRVYNNVCTYQYSIAKCGDEN